MHRVILVHVNIRKKRATAKATTPSAKNLKAAKSQSNDYSKQLDATNLLLLELNENIEKRLSWRENFKMGIVRGLGGAIGATVVAALVFAILGRVINTVDDVPVIREIINSLPEEIDDETM